MNTLNIIKTQIQKAAALHDAQIAMTTYRGVKFECKQGVADEVHGTFCSDDDGWRSCSVPQMRSTATSRIGTCRVLAACMACFGA